MAKDAKAKTFLMSVNGGRRYSRGPTDTNSPTAPSWISGSDPVPNQTTISILWVNGVDAETGIQDTLAEIRPNGTSMWTQTVVPYPGVTYTFTGLSAGTPYDVRIANRDNAGNVSSYAPIKTVTTTGSSADVAPGTVSISATSVSVTAGAPLSVAVTRSGAGPSSAAIEVDWAFTGFVEGTPSPANGTLSFPSAQNGPQSLISTAGSVTSKRTGTLSIVAARALTGTLQPSIGAASVPVSIVQAATGKKWNPGHYGISNQNTFLNDSKRSQQLAEINEVIAQPNVLGLKLIYYTGIFGSPGSFDISKIFRDVNLLRAQGKRLMIMLQPEVFGGTDYTQLMPSAVYTDSSYGSSPTASVYGYWTINGGTGAALAWWRANVMNNYVIPLFTAIATTVNPTTGLTLDQDPYVEQICFGETSIGVTAGSDFTSANLLTQAKALVDCWAANFTHTVCMMNNNFLGSQSNSQNLANYCLSKGIAQGSPDIYAIGQRGPGTYDGLTWGQKAALGAVTSDSNFTGPDLRGQIGMMSDIEGPELSATSRYTMYTPHSFFTVADTILQQSHMMWTMINIGTNVAPIPAYPADGINTGASPGNWGSVLQVINGNPVTHIAKPTSIA